jgi:hypothetical protein
VLVYWLFGNVVVFVSVFLIVNDVFYFFGKELDKFTELLGLYDILIRIILKYMDNTIGNIFLIIHIFDESWMIGNLLYA